MPSYTVANIKYTSVYKSVVIESFDQISIDRTSVMMKLSEQNTVEWNEPELAAMQTNFLGDIESGSRYMHILYTYVVNIQCVVFSYFGSLCSYNFTNYEKN